MRSDAIYAATLCNPDGKSIGTADCIMEERRVRFIIRVLTIVSLPFVVVPAWGDSVSRPERFAQQAQPQAAANLSPVPIKTGVMRNRKGPNVIAPLKIETPASADYILKLVNTLNASEEMVIYVRRASNYETKVPLGTYSIRGAFGQTWYGEKYLFGPDTSYFKLVQKDGKSDQFSFRHTGNHVNGYFVQLIEQVAGNLETSTIKAEDF